MGDWKTKSTMTKRVHVEQPLQRREKRKKKKKSNRWNEAAPSTVKYYIVFTTNPSWKCKNRVEEPRFAATLHTKLQLVGVRHVCWCGRVWVKYSSLSSCERSFLIFLAKFHLNYDDLKIGVRVLVYFFIRSCWDQSRLNSVKCAFECNFPSICVYFVWCSIILWSCICDTRFNLRWKCIRVVFHWVLQWLHFHWYSSLVEFNMLLLTQLKNEVCLHSFYNKYRLCYSQYLCRVEHIQACVTYMASPDLKIVDKWFLFWMY